MSTLGISATAGECSRSMQLIFAKSRWEPIWKAFVLFWGNLLAIPFSLRSPVLFSPCIWMVPFCKRHWLTTRSRCVAVHLSPCKLTVNSLFCPAHGCTNSRFIIAELQIPPTRERFSGLSVMRTHWVQARARQGRTRSDLTRRALIGFRGQWRGSCHGHKRRTSQSPRSLSPVSCLLPLLLPSLSSSSFSLSFHPFLQSFLLFLLLSFVGLSCKCSCWPPILVVLRSLPKSNKHSFVVVSFVVGVRASWGTCCGSFLSFPFLFPRILRVSKRGISTNGAQLWLAHALTILVFSVSSGWLRLLQQVSCLRCVIFFSSWTFPTFPCLSLLSQAPPPFPILLFSVTLYLSLPSSFPVSGRPSFGSARLSCLVHVLSRRSKEKKFFPLLPFSSLCLSRPFLLSFDLYTRALLRCSWRSTPPSCSWCGPWESERCCEPCACAWRIWRGWSALRSFQYPGTALHSSWHSKASSRHIAVDRRCGAAGGPFFSFLSFFFSSSPSLPSPYPRPSLVFDFVDEGGVMCAISVRC